MNGAPLTKHEILDAIDTINRVVDQRGREMDGKWGIGRLPTLVPIEWAERFRSQHRKYSTALWAYELDDVRKHGDAMLRAYDRLDQLATEAGRPGIDPNQWEIEGPDGLIILTKDPKRTDMAELHGRAAQVWSIDEIARVVHTHPILAAAKEAFPGAEIETVRPPIDFNRQLNDDLSDIPGW